MKRKQSQKRREEAPSLEGMSQLTACLVNSCMCPTPTVSTRGCNLGCGGGGGGECGWNTQGEKEMFRVDRHLFYASHAAAGTHWEQQKATAAGEKAAKVKKEA